MYRTLETSAFLFLLLEFVPGQDLFYFLEEARDHYDLDPTSDPPLNRTPPTPDLLSSLHPSQLLSSTRLRLIASLFAQMCEAVATCHDASVSHRDIKPENFILTDGWTVNQDGIHERKVVVKLSDFGLSTCDAVSSDMDCGSAPYMSFGTPVFRILFTLAYLYSQNAETTWPLCTSPMPQIYGLSALSSSTCTLPHHRHASCYFLFSPFASWDRRLPVIASRLYHYNPWMDTATGECSSFQLYLSNPANFFMRRFAGMTLPVANFLVENVFCILDDPTDDSQRIGAREFGVWIRDLPTLIRASQPLTNTHTHPHSRVPSTASIPGHLTVSAWTSCRPSSRPDSAAGGSPRRPPVALRGVISQNSTETVLDHDGPDGTLSPAPDLVLNEEDEDEGRQQLRDEQQADDGLPSLYTTKRRKRGRKGKGMTPSTDHTQMYERLALASQMLVCELNSQTRSAPTFFEAVPVTVSPSVTKKQRRWELSFGKSAGENDAQDLGETGHCMVANVENIVRNIEDQKERDKTRDILSRIEGIDKVKELAVPKPSRVLVEERILTPRELSDSSKPSSPLPVGTTKAKRGKTSFKRLSDVLQNGGGGVGGKKDMWLVVFNDVVLRCQRTGTTSLPLGSAYASQANSLPELQGKCEDATTRRNSTAQPRNLYKYIKVGFRPFPIWE